MGGHSAIFILAQIFRIILIYINIYNMIKIITNFHMIFNCQYLDKSILFYHLIIFQLKSSYYLHFINLILFK